MNRILMHMNDNKKQTTEMRELFGARSRHLQRYNVLVHITMIGPREQSVSAKLGPIAYLLDVHLF